MDTKEAETAGCDVGEIIEKIRRRADDFKRGLDLVEAIVTEVWEPVEGCEVELFLLVEHPGATLTIANFRHSGFSEEDGSPAIEAENIYVPAASTAFLKRYFDRAR